MSHRTIMFTGLLLLSLGLRVDAASLFEESAVLEIKLAGPFKELFSDKKSEKELPFTLRVDGVDHEIEIRPRGNSRRKECGFPPLRLNFRTEAAAGSLFENQDKLKFVTHCKESDAAEQDLLKEYMAYRIFNMISEKSYRVRLASMTYTDTDPKRRNKTLERYGYIIESNDELGERISATQVNRTGITRESLDAEQAALVFVFHYLIGNTDWSLVAAYHDEFCCHNGKLFERESELILVPYDFDYSGLVDAPYAVPDPDLRIRSVKKRLYRGYCVPPQDLTNALLAITGMQSEILNIPAEVPGLTSRERDTAARYLRGFFKDVRNLEKSARKFHSRCI